MEYILSCIYLIVTGAVIFSMAVLFAQGKKIFSNKMYILCHLCAAIWCSSQLLISIAYNEFSLSVSYCYGNIGICFSGALWILFAASFGADNFKPKKLYFIPFIISLVNYILILTNNWHHLYYSVFSVNEISHGILFFANVAETYLYILIGSIILAKKVKKIRKAENDSVKAEGSILIIGAVIMPLIFSLLNISGIVNTGYDITPLGFAISIILVRAATIRYQFFDMKKELDITTEKLILANERNRIAQEVHDTTGHTLTMLQSYMKLASVAIDSEDNATALNHIKEARELTSLGIRELRESINQLREEDETTTVSGGILRLAHRVKEIPCEVTIKGEDSDKYNHLSKAAFDTVRESITNTLKYAKATKIDIIIKFKNDSVDIIIADDGIGCENIQDNNGLRGIKKRVALCGGTVKFVTSPGDGFMTRVTLSL